MKIDLGNMNIKEVAEALIYLYDSDDFCEVIGGIKIIVPDENTVELLRERLSFEGLPDELMPEMVIYGTHILDIDRDRKEQRALELLELANEKADKILAKYEEK